MILRSLYFAVTFSHLRTPVADKNTFWHSSTLFVLFLFFFVLIREVVGEGCVLQVVYLPGLVQQIASPPHWAIPPRHTFCCCFATPTGMRRTTSPSSPQRQKKKKGKAASGSSSLNGISKKNGRRKKKQEDKKVHMSITEATYGGPAVVSWYVPNCILVTSSKYFDGFSFILFVSASSLLNVFFRFYQNIIHISMLLFMKEDAPSLLCCQECKIK